MQEKERKISPIKQRILQFVENLGISKRKFYEETGISRGTLESNTGITEDIMAKVFAAHPELSSEWLLTGEGDMMKGDIHISGNPHHIGNIGGAGNTAHMTINAWGYQKIIRENYIELVPLDSGEKGTPVSAEEMVKEYNATQLELAAAKRDIERKDKIIRQYEALIDRQAALVEKAKK